MESSKAQDTDTLVRSNKKYPLLEVGHYLKIGDMWNLKHDIISPKFDDLLIKTPLKGDTDLDLKNFYNHINMCLNVVTRIRDYLLPAYNSIKRHFEFQ